VLRRAGREKGLPRFPHASDSLLNSRAGIVARRCELRLNFLLYLFSYEIIFRLGEGSRSIVIKTKIQTRAVKNSRIHEVCRASPSGKVSVEEQSFKICAA
jgi:hypothetical protein